MDNNHDLDSLKSVMRAALAPPTSPIHHRHNVRDQPIQTCNLCGCVLTEENWPKSFRDKPRGVHGGGTQYCCSGCHTRRVVAAAARKIDLDALAIAVMGWIDTRYDPKPPGV